MINRIPNAGLLAKHPVIQKASAVGSALVIGLALSTALFCAADTLISSRSSFPDSNRLVTIWGNLASKGLTRLPSSDPDVKIWMERTDLFEAVAAGTQESLIVEKLGDASIARIANVSTRFFPALQIKAAIGRTFTADDYSGNIRSAILTHEFWARSTGSDPKILGRTLSIDGQTYTVIGVLHPMKMPAEWGPTPELWIPLRAVFEGAGCADCHGLRVIARLAGGVGIQQAQSAMTKLADQRAKEFAASNLGRGVDLVPFDSQSAETGRILVAIWLLIGITLLSTATAAVTLITSDAASQTDRAELIPAGVLTRKIVGYQIATAILSAAVAFGVAAVAVRVVSSSWASGNPILGHEQINISLRSVIFCLGCGIVSGFVLGFAKVRSMYGRLQTGSLEAAGPGRLLTPLISGIAILQTAIAFVFTVGAALMVISSYRLTHAPIGFDPEHLLTMRLTVPAYKYVTGGRLDGDRMMAAIDDVVAQIRTIPEVRSVAATYNLPLDSTWNNRRFQMADRPQQTVTQQQRAEFRVITPGYFRTMNIPVKAGRDFSDADSAKAPPVAIINETLARQFWGNTDPIGQHIRLGAAANSGYPWLTVIGVVGDVRDLSVREPAKPEIFQDHLQWGWYYTNLVIRSDLDTSRLSQRVAAATARYRTEMPMTNVKTMRAIVQSSISLERATTVILVSLSIFTVLLEMITLYAVSRRIPANRAWSADHTSRTIRYVLYHALAASCLGVLASVRLGRILSALLFGVTSPSYFVLALTLGALLALNLAVVSIAINKATHVIRLRAYA